MSNRRSANNNMPFSALQPTSIIPLKYPCFSVNHYNKPCSSAYQNRNSSAGLPRVGKRKNNSSTESMFHPLTKQQITEARIAASMQMLSLENPILSNENVHTTKRTEDEGFCEDMNIESEDVQSSVVEETNSGNNKLLPQYRLADDVKEGITEIMNGILPEKIYKTMNQSCLALIPYVPPTNILPISSANEINCDETSSNSTEVLSPSHFENKLKYEVSDEECMLY